jgi:hypothetical protein
MAGRLVLDAPDLDQARRLAEAALTQRRETTRLSGDRSTWSLGVLRPLTPKAPGTHRYRATFALWEAEADRFTRRDVHCLEIWAIDAASARRTAQQQAQALADYSPTWRIRSVERVGTSRPQRRQKTGKTAAAE